MWRFFYIDRTQVLTPAIRPTGSSSLPLARLTDKNWRSMLDGQPARRRASAWYRAASNGFGVRVEVFMENSAIELGLMLCLVYRYDKAPLIVEIEAQMPVPLDGPKVRLKNLNLAKLQHPCVSADRDQD
ncbi:hypothetical protein [Pseudomonas sp. 3JA]|uniref:hypothetical protein n=1 Tax=Pseudomonas sp. 3JA TaxID=3109347 RepID=UPI00300BB854